MAISLPPPTSRWICDQCSFTNLSLLCTCRHAFNPFSPLLLHLSLLCFTHCHLSSRAPPQNPIPAGDCRCRKFAPSAGLLVLPARTVMDVPYLQQAYGAPSYLPADGMEFIFSQPQQSPLQAFWASQMAEIEAQKDFKNHSLPLARIKRIMKANSEVKMIASEVPVVFSKACTIFILELTFKAWNNTVGNKRRTIQRCDIAAAIKQTEVFDFLIDVIPGVDVICRTAAAIKQTEVFDSLVDVVPGDDDVKDDAPTGDPLAPFFLVPTQPEAMMPLMQDPANPYACYWQTPVQGHNSGVEVEPQTADKA